MCGRYTITLDPGDFELELGVGDFPSDFEKRYNVAPTQQVAVVRDPESRKVEWLKWGLIPYWAKDPAIGARMINARSETLLEKPSFRDAFTKRRCLILADGFYEWQKLPGKQPSIPHYFSLKNNKPFFFAGLWDQWQANKSEALTTCTIITVAPNEIVQPIHDRMPVMFDSQNGWRWLNPTSAIGALQGLLIPFPSEEMIEHQVSMRINQPGVESSDLTKRL